MLAATQHQRSLCKAVQESTAPTLTTCHRPAYLSAAVTQSSCCCAHVTLITLEHTVNLASAQCCPQLFDLLHYVLCDSFIFFFLGTDPPPRSPFFPHASLFR